MSESVWSRFLVYKLPEDPNSADEGFRRGAAYFFMTPRSAEGEWTRSGRLIQNPDSLLAMAIKPLLENVSGGRWGVEKLIAPSSVPEI
jgi:hypothetical protein